MIATVKTSGGSFHLGPTIDILPKREIQSLSPRDSTFSEADGIVGSVVARAE